MSTFVNNWRDIYPLISAIDCIIILFLNFLKPLNHKSFNTTGLTSYRPLNFPIYSTIIFLLYRLKPLNNKSFDTTRQFYNLRKILILKCPLLSTLKCNLLLHRSPLICELNWTKIFLLYFLKPLYKKSFDIAGQFYFQQNF